MTNVFFFLAASVMTLKLGQAYDFTAPTPSSEDFRRNMKEFRRNMGRHRKNMARHVKNVQESCQRTQQDMENKAIACPHMLLSQRVIEAKHIKSIIMDASHVHQCLVSLESSPDQNLRLEIRTNAAHAPWKPPVVENGKLMLTSGPMVSPNTEKTCVYYILALPKGMHLDIAAQNLLVTSRNMWQKNFLSINASQEIYVHFIKEHPHSHSESFRHYMSDTNRVLHLCFSPEGETFHASQKNTQEEKTPNHGHQKDPGQKHHLQNIRQGSQAPQEKIRQDIARLQELLREEKEGCQQQVHDHLHPTEN